VVSWYGARLIFGWRELKVEMGMHEGERKRLIFFIKKTNWEATVLPNTLGSTVATQPKYVKIGCLLEIKFWCFL
jgi:hypothetical protein